MTRFIEASDIVSHISHCENVLELSDILYWAVNLIDDNEVYEDLYKALQDTEPTVGKPYRILEGPKCIKSFLLCNWDLLDNALENGCHLCGLADSIKETYVQATGTAITTAQVHQVMQHVEQLYGFCSKLLIENPLKILLLPNTHKEWNGLYQCRTEATQPNNEAIILTSITQEEVCPEAVILHELGHLLHTRMVGKLWVAPKSFEYLVHRMFFALMLKPARESAECFAESFAVAAVQNSSFREHTAWSVLSKSSKSEMAHYFSVLLGTLEQNEGGMLTWAEIEQLHQSSAETRA